MTIPADPQDTQQGAAPGLISKVWTRIRHSGAKADTPSETAVIAYVPVDKETRKRLKTMIVVGDKYAWHDGRIGWCEVRKFDSYSQYNEFLKADITYQAWLKRRQKKQIRASGDLPQTGLGNSQDSSTPTALSSEADNRV